MTRSWITFVLWTTFLFLFGLGDSHVLQLRADDDTVSTVFRGDLRTPEQIKAAGGFFPKDAVKELGRAPTAKELDQGSSLFFHHTGHSKKYTQYVSTTTEPKIARDFSEEFLSPKKVAEGATKRFGYIYRISADPKMVDMVKSLGREHVLEEYAEQAEQAVVGGVPFDQIEGWYDAKKIGDAELAKLRSGDKVENLLTANDQFNPKYTPLRSSGAQPQLAGFGTRGKGAIARKKSPWKDFKGQSVKENLEKFRMKVAPDVKAPEGAVEAEEPAIFVKADPLGARAEVGSLDIGEVPEGLTSVKLAEAGRAAEEVEVTTELEAEEVAETAGAVEAEELLGAGEVAAGVEEVAVAEEIEIVVVLLA
ncbi:Heat-labile enterotoxin IIB, A chain [Fusarium austroafricanum]|uniref:Heat-labile enterotoxin IIB, A chain n=1 Tax=Fusarium austroafricanum TaxID=2364996 RepID=A0A8H4P2V5_9HYPO|nr:Heat-labile enterotoxin IIB, A chain [Fusarium austroafricanum]